MQALLVSIIKWFLISVLGPIVTESVKDWINEKEQSIKDKKERDQKIKEAIAKYNQATSAEEQENAFQDLIDKSRF